MRGGEYPTEIPQRGNFREFWKWRRDRKKLVRMHEERGEALPALHRDGLGLLHSSDDTITWSGHASTVTRLDGRTILSDPVWSNRIAMIVKRMTPPVPAWKDLPPPDLITISHNHYDHLDAATMRRVKKETPVAVPRGVGPWFKRRGFHQVLELAWWETRELNGVKVTFVPSQHFSGRTLWDRNKSLFGGWVIEGTRHRIYHSGDTGYFRGFAEIADSFGALDAACLPIGAYLPRWLMQGIHTTPEEATQAFVDLKARRMLPIHWGTFRLSDEAMDDPPRHVRDAMRKLGLTEDRLLLGGLGQPYRL